MKLKLQWNYLFLALILVYLLNCKYFQRTKYVYESMIIYKKIPEECKEIKGINKSQVMVARNEQELIQFYGMTNLVYFKGETTPILYGSLYYLDFDNEIYCMALLHGYFAVIYNKKNTMVQEICYPIKECSVYDKNRYIYNIIK